ncbi:MULTISPECIES: helix-turn-helix transcriptional regulator [Serratia]|uniref:helix-turn-helix transcriptional regulator n=1 Tax=Serratia TaxID=613 RepID=UPI001F4BF8B4|nr:MULTISPECIES: helix-turn-helix transcriptional regulator [Serratia]ULG10896.1 helix-turn-helix transcriptional regulator [Serratia entomophila]CAI1948117.1 Spore germination protein gerE [Serratia quinivorans]CAI2158923.1 Spore germination protein gerE [Serratia quinivorans]
MKSTVTVLIVEPNVYFSHGLIEGILTHFNLLDIPLRFTHAMADKTIADMVFMAAELEGPQLRYLTQRETAPPHQHIYIFKEKPGPADKTHYKELNGIFYRYQSLDWAVQIVAQALQGLSALKARSFRAITAVSLTEREREILSYLSKGQRSRDISHRLHISQKTVSGHKRNAMAKLGISRSPDLNYWLLRGGLSQLAPSPGRPPAPAYRTFSPCRPCVVSSLRPLRAG